MGIGKKSNEVEERKNCWYKVQERVGENEMNGKAWYLSLKCGKKLNRSGKKRK